MKKLKNLELTCIACPEQYEGELETGERVYIRCRWGRARLDIDGQTASVIDYQDDMQGIMNKGDLDKLLSQANIEK